MMKGRRSNARLVNFAESVIFKIPKTSQRVGKFEDRWEIGIWVGITMRTGEHLVATCQGEFRVSAIMRRPADQRWSEELVKSMKGTPEEPLPGSNSRRIPAFANKYKEANLEKIAYAPMPATEEEQDPRRAKIQKEDIETYGPSEKCPGCKAQVAGKYRSKHTTNAVVDLRKFWHKMRRADGDSKQPPRGDWTPSQRRRASFKIR